MLSFLKNIQALYRIKESYGSTNSILKAIVGVLNTLETDVKDITLEGCITTARGQWLDEWGNWIGVHRYSRETDDMHRGRILTKLKNSSSTLEALKINSANFYNSQENSLWHYNKEDWVITENWKYINLLSVRGRLSSNFVFPDKDFYNWCTIQITSPEDITPEYKELIDTIKAAGIKVYYLRDIMPRTFLKLIDWYTEYRAHLMYFTIQNKGELHGYYSGILDWYGYYGESLPLSFETPDSFTELLTLKLLRQLSKKEKKEVLQRLYSVKEFYSREEYNFIQGILFHIWRILGIRISGTFEPIFLSNLAMCSKYRENHKVINSLFYLYHFLHIDYRMMGVNLVSSSGVLLDHLDRARFIQDWWSQLYTLEDAMDFYPNEPMYDLDYKTSMHITRVHGYNSKFLR